MCVYVQAHVALYIRSKRAVERGSTSRCRCSNQDKHRRLRIKRGDAEPGRWRTMKGKRGRHDRER